MRARILKASPRFAGMSIQKALKEPLGFTICVNDPAVQALQPGLFQVARCEYGYYLDTFLNAQAPLVQNSETCVTNRDFLFLHV